MSDSDFFFYRSDAHRDLHSFPTRRSSDLSIWSARKGQLGHPSSHPGPNMKRYTISWRRRSKRSASVALPSALRSEEHTSELQSPVHLVCRLLLEKKKKKP